jgi:hypothetical protein
MPTKTGTTTRRPAAAKEPSDRRPSADELRAEALNERPDGADLLRDPLTLRSRDRAKILGLGAQMSQDSAAYSGGLNDDATAADQLQAVTVGLELVTRIDEMLEEEFALDPAEYGSWATVAGGGPSPDERIVTLFSWYAGVLGE